jgi:hypothetical protein
MNSYLYVNPYSYDSTEDFEDAVARWVDDEEGRCQKADDEASEPKEE